MQTPNEKQRSKVPDGLGAILVFREGSEKGRQFPIVFQRTIIGRKKGDILVRDLAVSSEHAALDYRRGIFHIVDLQSRNGTFVNDKKIKDQQILLEQEVRVGDSIFYLVLEPEAYDLLVEQQQHLPSRHRGLADLIQKEFFAEERQEATSINHQNVAQEVARPKCIKLKVTLKNGKSVKLKYIKEKILIGREETDLVINDLEVSRKHAYLELQPNSEVVIQDLASANGTFVNDKRITRRLLLQNDKVRIGQTEVVFLGVYDNE